jgi:hypothetical protein
MTEMRIFALAENDPAYTSGARFALCRPNWAEWEDGEGGKPSTVVMAFAKFASLEEAQRAARTGCVFSTRPGWLQVDREIVYPIG